MEMDFKAAFYDIYSTICRPGAKELLSYLETTDFFTAPASTQFHGSHEGGLIEHSVNVCHCLIDILKRDRIQNLYNLHYSLESQVIVSLLHDVCKINFYELEYRNKKIDNEWKQVPFYKIADKLPYGHGEKSVFMISRYMWLTDEEAIAIRYHMGFSGTEDKRSIGTAFQNYPLSFLLSMADMEATYFLDRKPEEKK